MDRTLGAYTALEKLLSVGKVRAIGVSNFMPQHLERLLDKATVVPAVNQIEVHPYFQQKALQALDARHRILNQAWSPIGGITFYRDSNRSTLEDPTLLGIARTHGKSATQVMLRWHLQEGRSAIPKSTKPARIAENFNILDFELSAEQIAQSTPSTRVCAAVPNRTASLSKHLAGRSRKHEDDRHMKKENPRKKRPPR